MDALGLGIFALIIITIPLVDDPELDLVSELNDPGTVFSVASPASHASWSAMFSAANAANADTVELGPGDYYAAWGDMRTNIIGSPGNGTAGRRRVIKYVSDTPPWKRAVNDRAVVGPMQWWDDQYWIISGLTCEQATSIWPPSIGFVLHQNHWKGAPYYCVRCFGSNNTIQRNYFDTMASTGNDAPCIQLQPVHTVTGTGTAPTDNKILDNEVRDWNDGIVFTADEDYSITENYIDGTIVRGNDIYLTAAKYLYENGGEYSDAENPFDFKLGASSAAAPVLVAKNRCWGFRYIAPSLQQGGKSSNGALVTNHVYSQNILFHDNIMGDSPIGWIEHKWLGHLPYTPPSIADPRGTILRNNIWYGIKSFSPSDTGTGAYRTTVGVEIDGDRVVGSEILGSHAVQLPEYGDTTLDNAKIKNVGDLGEFADYWADGSGNEEDPDLVIYYQRKRLSGPEWEAIGVRVATTTIETIREKMETLIHALTPTTHANQKFRIERGEIDFRDWAQKNPTAAFRRYALEVVGPSEKGEVDHYDSKEAYTAYQVIVAYPHQWGRYGPQNVQDMRDTVDADAFQLRDTLSDMNNWVAGQRDANDTHELEEAEGVTFLVINLDIVYFRSNAS